MVSGAASRKNHGNVCAFTTDCHDDCRPLAGLLLGMDGIANLHGWQWLFVAVGLPAVLLALPTFLWLPDNIDKVKWLSIEQKQWLKMNSLKMKPNMTKPDMPIHYML